MPARSNPFQRLILRIHEQLASVGIEVTVEESGFTDEPSSGAPRETDVKVLMQTPDRVGRIAVECRDHARVQSVEWIDLLIGKYIDLGFDKVIAVSSSGFSDTAVAKAKSHSIECRSLTEVTDIEWPAEFTKIGVSKVVHRVVDGQLSIKCEPPLADWDAADDTVTIQGQKRSLHEVIKLMEKEAFDEFLRARPQTFGVLADFDKNYRVEIVRVPPETHISHGNASHLVLQFSFACTVVTTRTTLQTSHQRYPEAIVSKAQAVGGGLTVIQVAGGVLQSYNGAMLDKCDTTPFESAGEIERRDC